MNRLGGIHRQEAIVPESLGAATWANLATEGAIRPVLSVCIPFYKFDVMPLVQELLRQGAPFAGDLELLLADDASGDEALVNRIQSATREASVAVRLLVYSRNLGRSVIRNRLAVAAAASYILFMDADAFPDSGSYLQRYLIEAARATADVVVGGRSYALVRSTPKNQQLYLYYSRRTECAPADRRSATAWRHVFTNNIMIRRNLLLETPFDDAYSGWGYEDTDWAIKIMKKGATVVHIDNTATHLGLIDDESLVCKYRESVPNFERLLDKFPDELQSSPVYRLARLFARVGLKTALPERLCQRLILEPKLPLFLRYSLLQCFKALIYTPALRRKRS